MVARDKWGGLTAAGPATTITNGLATIGQNTCTITTLTRSGSTITGNTSSCTGGAQNLAVGALVHISGSSNAEFSGTFNVATVNNGGSTFTATNTGLDTNLGDAASATGGQIAYFTGNYIQSGTIPTGTWEFYICGQRPGDAGYHVIGVTSPDQPTGGLYPGANTFFDWGATLLGSQTYP